MKRLIPTIFFYSILGLDSEGSTISYGNGEIDNDPSEPMVSQLLKIAKHNNDNVVRIIITSLVPLAFEVIEDV